MKNTVDPMAVQSGLQAALLAQRGYEGPEHVLEGKEGLTDTLGGRFDLNVLIEDLGKDYRITRCSMKAFPTEALTHSPISALIELMRKYQLKKEDITQVTVRTVSRAADILSDPSKYDPRTRETADHSLPYCLAVTIVDGTVTPESFTTEKIFDPQIRSYLPKIKVLADPEIEKTFPALKRAAVEVMSSRGQKYTHQVDYPLGDYRNPMDDRTFYAKFDSLVLPVISKKKRDRIVKTVMDLENLKDSAKLVNQLAG
jgi:2-methylcitrate dehydratase